MAQLLANGRFHHQLVERQYIGLRLPLNGVRLDPKADATA